jgi:hypothetical protein
MAVRFDADGEDFTRTVSLGTVSQFSVIAWVKISVDRNTNQTVWTLDNGNADYIAVCTNTDGTTMKFFTESNSSGSAQNFTVGTWYAVACSVNGVNGSMWTRAITDAAWTAITWTNGTANTTGTTLRIGEHPGTGLWLNGAIAAFKAWNGVTFTQADFDNEVRYYRPQRTTNLIAWYPFLVTETADYSGNGNTLSGGAGTTTEDGPPIAWGPIRNTLFPVLAPSTITSTLAGDLPSITGSFTGTERITSTLAGTLPGITGSFTATERITSTLAGTLPAITGSFTGTEKVTASLSGVLPAITGSFTAAEEIHSTLAGTLPALTGSLSGSLEIGTSLNGILPAITGSLVGEVRATSTLAGTLPSITGSFTVTVDTGIRGLIITVVGPALPDQVRTGPALQRVTTGPDLQRALTGTGHRTITLTGVAASVHVPTGPAIERVTAGPAIEREITGVGL